MDESIEGGMKETDVNLCTHHRSGKARLDF
jgi:hypothetical protein